MAFMEFTNRSVQYPFRRKLTLVAGTTDVYEITRTGVEGTVFAEGVMFNEANMGEMQDEIVNYVEGTVLWTNSSPTSSFAGQTVTLSESLEGFRCYEIISASSNVTDSPVVSTGRIPVARKTNSFYGGGSNIIRPVNSIGGNSITFGDAQNYALSTGVGVATNNRLIPLQLIGYK